MKPEFRFRLNGVVIPEILVQPKMVDGAPSGQLQIAVNDWAIGWFTIDDNENLWDEHLPRFVLEFASVPMAGRGWQRVTTEELLAVLECAGLITRG